MTLHVYIHTSCACHLHVLQTQATPGEQETRYKEYSDANQWGAEFEFASISELVVNNLEKVVAAFNGACDTAGQSCRMIYTAER